MSTLATIILTRILKRQNEELIKSICQEYGLSLEEMLQKYHTPTFYLPDVIQRDANIVVKDIKNTYKKKNKECVQQEKEDT